MKKLASLLLLLAVLHVRADIVIVHSMQVKDGAPQAIVTKIKGAKSRSDMGSQTSIIRNMATGQVLMLLHPQKNFIKMRPAPPVKIAAGATPMPASVMTDTGRQEKVGDYNAEVYTTESAGSKYTYWISSEVPHLEEMRDYLKKAFPLLQKMAKEGPASMPDITGLNGVPVKTVIVSPTGAVVTTTLISVRAQLVDDSEFLLPDDYLEAPTADTFGKGGKAVPTP